MRRPACSLVAVLIALGLAGCSMSGEGGADTPPSISASTPCAIWLHDSMNAREGFLKGYWTNLSEHHVQAIIEIKDTACRIAEGGAEPGKEPAVGPFQPLVDEIISGTYG